MHVLLYFPEIKNQFRSIKKTTERDKKENLLTIQSQISTRKDKTHSGTNTPVFGNEQY